VKRGSGKKHGPFRRYDEAGNLVLTGAYKNDLAHGTWNVFHTDGARLGRYRMNRGTGTVMEYFEDKTPRSSTAYRRGRKHGAYKEWTRKKINSGQYRHGLLLTGRYKNDRKDGRWQYHAPGGITEVYVRGKRTKVITSDGEVHQGAGILGRLSMAKNKPLGRGDGLTGLVGSLQGSVVSPAKHKAMVADAEKREREQARKRKERRTALRAQAKVVVESVKIVQGEPARDLRERLSQHLSQRLRRVERCYVAQLELSEKPASYTVRGMFRVEDDGGTRNSLLVKEGLGLRDKLRGCLGRVLAFRPPPGEKGPVIVEYVISLKHR
jgi:hypothetical protein